MMRLKLSLPAGFALVLGVACAWTVVMGCDDEPAAPGPGTAAVANEPAATSAPERPAAEQPARDQPIQEAPARARSSPLEPGAAAPMVTRSMRNIDGAQTSIGAVRGEKGTLVVFTCNHCPWAQAWEARLTALGNEYRSLGIGVIAINPNDSERYPEDGFEQMQVRAREAGMEFPYVVDETSDVARAYGATKTPEAFLFGADLTLVYHGAVDDNAHEEDQVEQRYLRDALQALATGATITRSETSALGCSIKFRGES